MDAVRHYAALIITVLLGPLLPERYRPSWPRPDLMETPGVQTSHAFLCTLVAFALWAWGFILYQAAMSELVTTLMTDPNQHYDGDVAPTHLGMVMYFAYLFTPRGALATIFLIDSVARLVAGAMSGKVPGSLYLAVPLALFRLVKRVVHEGTLTARYGPASEPDRISVEGDLLKVRRTRPHPEWNAHLAFRHDGKLYKLHNYDDGALFGGRPCFEYQFKPWPEDAILRRVVDI